MAARCASCSYPLSVSDSVSCCECSGYFHIDCAQLVGFPYYELSTDPVRNTFHCRTCKIIPLLSEGDEESDSDDEMPSRALEYHLEGQQDMVKDMNELRATVQDLSDLCKEMFREISELKSINLTLRCCVENLRHDGEQKNALICDLTTRIEALEGKGISSFKPINVSDTIDGLSNENDGDPDRHLTPDLEYSKLMEIESEDQENSFNITNENSTPQYGKHSENIEKTRAKGDSFNEHETLEESKGNVHFADEEIIFKSTEEDDIGNKSVKNWDWRGNEAIQLQEEKYVCSEAEEDEEDAEHEIKDAEEAEAQDWKILEEEAKSKFTSRYYEEEDSTNNESSVKDFVEKRITWADDVDDYGDEDEILELSGDHEENRLNSGTQHMAENYAVDVHTQLPNEGEENEEVNEYGTEKSERTSLKEEEEVEKAKTEDTESVEGVVEVEDYIKKVYGGRDSTEGRRPEVEGQGRLGGDVTAEGAPPEEEVEGGQSPQGEVQPSEASEGSEPPPPQQPQHSPDDLWDYLKETVSVEHPATVEEFVQKLIGTLEHVPEEYLKPVIDYNIKRATTPSVTDGEHLETNEGGDNIQVEDYRRADAGSNEVRLQEDGVSTVEGGDQAMGETFPVGEDVPSEDPQFPKDIPDFPKEPSESAEGYSALEAAS